MGTWVDQRRGKGQTVNGKLLTLRSHNYAIYSVFHVCKLQFSDEKNIKMSSINLSLLSRSFSDHHLRCGGWLNLEFSKREKH